MSFWALFPIPCARGRGRVDVGTRVGVGAPPRVPLRCGAGGAVGVFGHSNWLPFINGTGTGGTRPANARVRRQLQRPAPQEREQRRQRRRRRGMLEACCCAADTIRIDQKKKPLAKEQAIQLVHGGSFYPPTPRVLSVPPCLSMPLCLSPVSVSLGCCIN